MDEDKDNSKKGEILDNPKDVPYDDDIVILSEEDGETIEAKLKAIRVKLKKCALERQEYLAGWQRAKADLINGKKENEKWREEFISFANRNLIDELLPVVDSFNMAFSNKEVWEGVPKNWRSGIEHIYTQLFGVLGRHGIEAVGTSGEVFNPELHVAIETVNTLNKDDDGKVAEVLQTGFKLKNKVVRPARVKVFAYKN